MPLTELNLEGTIGFNGNVRNAVMEVSKAALPHLVAATAATCATPASSWGAAPRWPLVRVGAGRARSVGEALTGLPRVCTETQPRGGGAGGGMRIGTPPHGPRAQAVRGRA